MCAFPRDLFPRQFGIMVDMKIMIVIGLVVILSYRQLSCWEVNALQSNKSNNLTLFVREIVGGPKKDRLFQNAKRQVEGGCRRI